MTELLQISLIVLMAYGHLKLYLDGLVLPLSPVKYNSHIPYGVATYWIGGKFVSYIDLRQ